MEHSFRFIYMISAILIAYGITTDTRKTFLFLCLRLFLSVSRLSSASFQIPTFFSLLLLLLLLTFIISISWKYISASNLFYGPRTEYHINLNLCYSRLTTMIFFGMSYLRGLAKANIIFLSMVFFGFDVAHESGYFLKLNYIKTVKTSK